jgi:two-component system response regulator FixJ
VIDDDEAVRDSLHALLEANGVAVETFPSAEEFLDAHQPSRTGCLLLDVRMPGMDGLDLQEKLHDEAATLPVIIITGHADVPIAVRAMKAGAVDFVEKPVREGPLLASIRVALHSAQGARSEQLAGEDAATRIAALTRREREVLERLVIGRANKQTAYELGISPRTVEIYRARVMQKMEAESLSHLVRMALAAGLSPEEV